MAEGQEELPVGLQPVDGLHRLVDAVVQALDLLLAGRGQEEAVHLGLQGVVDLNVDVVAARLLLVGAAQVLDCDGVIDHLGRRMNIERCDDYRSS